MEYRVFCQVHRRFILRPTYSFAPSYTVSVSGSLRKPLRSLAYLKTIAQGTRTRLGHTIALPVALVEPDREEELLMCPLTDSRPDGVQPRADVGGLRRLPYHPDEIIAECVKVCFVAHLG